MKRLLDILMSGAGLILVAPIIVLAAIAIKLTSLGPAFFVQERVGMKFRLFRIYKLRTMENTEAHGPSITSDGDARITKVGAILRRWKIDELPQLFNVLKGDMSFVGPRPEVPEYVGLFRQDYEEILVVRPGITDPASLKYARESEILAQAIDPAQAYTTQVLPDKIRLAKNYVREATMAGDFALICRTVARITH